MSLEKFLNLFQNRSVALSAKCAQYDSKELAILRDFDLFFPNPLHLFSCVHFMRQLLFERVILIEGQVRISDHTGLNMEAPVSNKDDYFTLFGCFKTILLCWVDYW